MATTNTTLAAPLGRNDLVATLASASGAVNGNLLLIGGEYMKQVGSPVGSVIALSRGLNGSAQISHDSGAGVVMGRASDFTVPDPVQAGIYVTAALDGDGSSARPLSVLVDGVTVVVNGSNELEAIGGGGGIGGSTGATDNAILVADGTGGATVKASTATIDGSGNITTPGYVEFGAGGPQVKSAGALFKLGAYDSSGATGAYFYAKAFSFINNEFFVGTDEGAMYIPTAFTVGWRSGSLAALDTGLARLSAGVLKVTDGSSGSGAIQSAYKSSDGSAGVTAGPFTAITAITVKDGIITAITGT